MDLNFSSPEVSVAVMNILKFLSYSFNLYDLVNRLKLRVISTFSKMSLKYLLKRQVLPEEALPIAAIWNL